jgi:hypothetical protein
VISSLESLAFIGSWLLPQLGIHLGSGIIAAIINATIGALILLLIIRLVRGGDVGSRPLVAPNEARPVAFAFPGGRFALTSR